MSNLWQVESAGDVDDDCKWIWGLTESEFLVISMKGEHPTLAMSASCEWYMYNQVTTTVLQDYLVVANIYFRLS